MSIKLYKTKEEAHRDAKRRDEVGLIGSGQTCEPQRINGANYAEGWIYKTWDDRYLVPDGEITAEEVEGLLSLRYQIKF